MPPAKLGHYEILEKIGAGGMGEVYRARDTRLGREVAIKLLPEGARRDTQALDRFRLEARTASSLNHPNICTIHDIGEHEGRPFIVMELLDGETLQRLLSRGPLPIDRCLDYAMQLTDALEAAHSKAIVHRDIKPGNIVVTGRGQLKILDFGLAKLEASRRGIGAEETVALDLTSPGFAVGTTAYMSPEQALGRTVDGRSDLFSLGAVLHEMACGLRAFTGNTAAAVTDAILHQPPSGALPIALSALQPILERLLEKDPERRYSSATALHSDLRKFRDTAASQHTPGASIAVLPFINMSADPENEYFTDGMAEEILTALSKIESLRVASRTSSFALKGRSEDVRSIGRMLGVESILEGSVRRSGKRLRVSVQLVKVEDGYRIWSERYERELEDVFAVQDEIAESVAAALRVVLSDRERSVIRKIPTQSIEAYDSYLRGRDQMRRLEAAAFSAGQRLFERATELDSKFTLAWVGIVESCHWMHMWIDHDPKFLAAAQAASRKAMSLDPDLAEAHVAVGLTSVMAGDHERARIAFERASQLDPQAFDPYYFSARNFVSQGMLAEAATMFSKAAEVCPEDYQSPTLLATCYMGLGRVEDARAAAIQGLTIIDKHLELFPNDVRATYLGAGNTWLAYGDREAALRRAHRALEIEPNSPSVRYNVACLYSNMRMFDEALDLLQENVATGWGQRTWIENDPDWRELKQNPRFTSILDQIRARD